MDALKRAYGGASEVHRVRGAVYIK